MNAPKQNYPIHDKELLVIVKAFEKWRIELEEQQKEPIQVISDHGALEHFLTKKILFYRQTRWSEFLFHFNFFIKYQPKTQNVLINILTRKTEDLQTRKTIQNQTKIQFLLKPCHFKNQARVQIALNNI